MTLHGIHIASYYGLASDISQSRRGARSERLAILSMGRCRPNSDETLDLDFGRETAETRFYCVCQGCGFAAAGKFFTYDILHLLYRLALPRIGLFPEDDLPLDREIAVLLFVAHTHLNRLGWMDTESSRVSCRSFLDILTTS